MDFIDLLLYILVISLYSFAETSSPEDIPLLPDQGEESIELTANRTLNVRPRIQTNGRLIEIAHNLCIPSLKHAYMSNKCMNPHSYCGLYLNLLQEHFEVNRYQAGKENESKHDSTLSTVKPAVCQLLADPEREIDHVEIVNSTYLVTQLTPNPNITTKTTEAKCVLVYFFSPYCPFSVQGSPYVNALARSLPHMPVYGLNSIENHGINNYFGVLGTPTLLLFHNGHTVGRYNESNYSVANLINFVKHITSYNLTYISVEKTDFEDINLPLKVAPYTPYARYLSQAFFIFHAFWLVFRSKYFKKLVTMVKYTWREAQAQQEPHED